MTLMDWCIKTNFEVESDCEEEHMESAQIIALMLVRNQAMVVLTFKSQTMSTN